jgi:hypothetical protein
MFTVDFSWLLLKKNNISYLLHNFGRRKYGDNAQDLIEGIHVTQYHMPLIKVQVVPFSATHFVAAPLL